MYLFFVVEVGQIIIAGIKLGHLVAMHMCSRYFDNQRYCTVQYQYTVVHDPITAFEFLR